MGEWRGDEEGEGCEPEKISMVSADEKSDHKDHSSNDNTDRSTMQVLTKAVIFKKMYLFAALAGVTSLFSEYIHIYMLSQVTFLRRQYKMDESTVDKLTLSSPIATVVTVLFLSVIARRVHIPKVLAFTSLIAGILSLLCIIPFIHTKCDLTDPPVVLKNETYTMEGLQLSVPSCYWNGIDPQTRNKISAVIFNIDHDGSGSVGASKQDRNKLEGSGVTILMPDFKKLKEHPIYPRLVPLAKGMGMDLEAVQSMTLPEQAEYIQSLPPNIQSMLPKLKAMLGPNPDQYFITYELPKSQLKTVPTTTTTTTTQTTTPEGSGVTMLMPDFYKLKENPIYPSLVLIAKNMEMDLEAVQSMTLPEQAKYLRSFPPDVQKTLPNLKAMLGPNPDQYFFIYELPKSLLITVQTTMQTTTPTSEGSGVTILMPDFKKLKEHPIYSTLVPMAKGMGMDLEAVQSMTLPEQAEYVQNLPPNIQAMLPNLKAMLGPNPDQYFITYELPKSRRKRATEEELQADSMYSGQLAKISPPVSREVQWKLLKAVCPFNTDQFHKHDHSNWIVAMFVIVMILHGIAVAPRAALIITFIEDNSNEASTGKYLGLITALANLGPILAVLLGFKSFMTYVTLEDVGHMSYFNPRWLPAWWLGFLILGLLSCVFSLPMAFLPSIMNPSESNSKRRKFKGYGWITYEFRNFLPAMFRLMTNSVYVLILIGSTLSYMAWVGVTSVLVNYVSTQFSLEPMIPGVILYTTFTIIFVCGIVVSGILTSRFQWSFVNCLKMAVILSVILVVIQGANIGFGCDQPEVDKGEKIVSNISTSVLCSKTCVCSELGYSPMCGSDGRSYYSPCHAGCADSYDGKFHNCKCVEDSEQTVKPSLCTQPCSMYYVFFAVLVIAGLVLGLRTIPLLMSSYRCVLSQDIPAAIGLKMFYIFLFGNIVSTYVFRGIESSACALERPECGILPTCALYDIVALRIRVFVTSLIFELVGALLLFVAFLRLRKRPLSELQV